MHTVVHALVHEPRPVIRPQHLRTVRIELLLRKPVVPLVAVVPLPAVPATMPLPVPVPMSMSVVTGKVTVPTRRGRQAPPIATTFA